MRDLKARGFEIGVHGYDHVRWQDHLDEIGEDGVRNELGDAFEVYRAMFGEASREFRGAGMAHERCGAASRSTRWDSTIAATRAASRRTDASSRGEFSRRRKFRPRCRRSTR